MSGVFSRLSGMAGAFASRRHELMKGGVDKLWEIQRAPKRVFLHNISRDINVQEAWFTTDGGDRQALGRVRPGERTEIRAFRRRSGEPISGRLEWRVRSMLIPARSIWRSEKLQDQPTADPVS